MGSLPVDRWSKWGVGLLLICACTVHAASRHNFDDLQKQLSLPNNAIDFAEAKLTVDRLIDPTIDADAVFSQLDQLVHAIRSRITPRLTPRARMDILLSTLYKAGLWNGNRPFTYDLDDPFGKNPRNKLLSTYLRTHKGNCVSMPILVAIIGQRLGLVVTLAEAPGHMLVKFADGQNWLNVEATAGGYKWDSSYVRDLDITALALESEIYLKPLTPSEAVGEMAGTLMEHLAVEKRADDLMAVADMVLAVNPKDVVAIIQKGNAYALQVGQRYGSKYQRPVDIPVNLQNDYQMRSRANLEWFAKAEALGWAPTTPENRARYLESVEQERVRRRQQ